MEAVLAQINAALICASLVLVRLTQSANIYPELDVAQYCADQRSLCQNTGSFIHVACQFYGKIGTSCSKFNEIPLEDSNENDILRRINTIRMQAAKGNATGKGQQKLPRAYGMKKVFWDAELAAFAKIMTLQCISKHRYTCAASKTFTSPLMIYSFANTTTNVSEIIANILSSWEADALRTTPDDILHSPDLKAGESRYYIKMVVADVTHVGCAAAVYEHEIRAIAIKARDNIQFSGHIICYLSEYSREGAPVYNTTAPVRGTGWTKCGCPPKYRETKNCLCVPSPPPEHILKRQTTAVPKTTKNMITTSTQAYYDDLDKYVQQINNMVSPGEKTQLLDLASKKQQNMIKQPELEPSQPKLEWSPQVSLTHKMQQMLESKIQQKLEETQAAPQGVENPASCSGGGRREPKIVMLPIFTIQNAPKHLSRRWGEGSNRRSVSNSSVTKTKGIDDISFSNERIDELPQNMSIRSKLLEAMAKIRNKQAADIFSNENAEHGQPTLEPIFTVEPTKYTVESSPPTNKGVQDDHIEDSKNTVLNILELLEKEQDMMEPVQSIAETSPRAIVKPVQNIARTSPSVTIKSTHDDPNKMAKKRVMHLLDLLEEKGEKAELTSREIVEFDAKMRRIYMRVIGTPRGGNGGNFIKLRNNKPF